MFPQALKDTAASLVILGRVTGGPLKGVGNEMNGGWWVYVNDRYINGTAALEVFFHFDRVVSL